MTESCNLQCLLADATWIGASGFGRNSLSIIFCPFLPRTIITESEFHFFLTQSYYDCHNLTAFVVVMLLLLAVDVSHTTAPVLLIPAQSTEAVGASENSSPGCLA